MIRPVDLPELRAATVAHARDQKWAAALRSAELIHVSAAMVELASAAATTLPKFQLQAEDLPMQSGFAFLEDLPEEFWNQLVEHGACQDPRCTADHQAKQLRGVQWALGSEGCCAQHAGPGVHVVFYAQDTRIDRLGRTHGHLQSTHTGFWHFDPELAAARNQAAVLEVCGPLVRSLWLLMSQPLAQETSAEVDRATRKRLLRAGYKAPRPVRVIDLRRPGRSHAPGDGSREYHHSWIVRGHWRQQWYPKREVHRPVWIAPHIKGPEDAPLIGGEKVYALRQTPAEAGRG